MAKTKVKAKTPPKPDVEIELLLMTPEMAAQDLAERNKGNRKIRKTHVAMHRTAMENGTHLFNGDTIRYDWNGELMDGQHRETAIVESGIPQWVIVVRGLDPKAYSTIDIGDKKNLSDNLYHSGFEHHRELSVALRLLWIRLNGMNVNQAKALPNSIAIDVLEEHEGLTAAVEAVIEIDAANEKSLKSLISLGYAGALFYLMSSATNASEAKLFWQFLASGVDDEGESLSSKNPVFKLRNKLIANRSPDTESKLKRDALVALIIKAFNLWVADEQVAKLELKRDEWPVLGGLDTGPPEEEELEEDEVADGV